MALLPLKNTPVTSRLTLIIFHPKSALLNILRVRHSEESNEGSGPHRNDRIFARHFLSSETPRSLSTGLLGPHVPRD